MTLQRRRRRNADIFDTGPFGAYNNFGFIDDGGDSGGGGGSDGGGSSNSEQIRYHSTYWYYVLPVYSTGSRPSILHYAWTVYDDVNDVGTTDPLASGTGVTDEMADAAAKSAIDTLKIEAEAAAAAAEGYIIYLTWADVYYHHMIMGQLTTEQAKDILANQFNISGEGLARYPGQWGSGMAYYDESTFLEQFEVHDRQEEGEIEEYAPQIPVIDYEAGSYLLPNVGNATMADQPIPTNTAYKYWDGNLKSHNWADHGMSTPEMGDVKDGGRYPKPIVDSYGGYAVSLSHYIASYDPNGAFLGFRVLTASELEGGIPAGIPIATVMQMFTKCAKSRNGHDFKNNGRNFMLDTEKEPVWRKALDMPMQPKSFFLCETAFARGRPIPKPTGGRDNQVIIEGTHGFNNDDLTIAYDTGYNDVKSVFGNLGREDTLNREVYEKAGDEATAEAGFSGLGFKMTWSPPSKASGWRSKVYYAAKVEWLGENGQFGAYSTHPESIPDCDSEQGKTMVIYRFPRQLDPVVDKNLLDFYAANGMPNYDITHTGKCYPFPEVHTMSSGDVSSYTDARDTKYGLIGRLMPTNSDAIDAEKYEAEYNGEVYAGRRVISFLPMISPSLPPSNRHRPYILNGEDLWPLYSASMHYKKTDWFCFDTGLITGAAISITDPYKKAYLGSGRVTNAYFPKANLDVGSTAFAVGQCMLAYDMESPSVDARLGENFPTVNLPHSSERIIITTEPGKMDSAGMPFRSKELDPIGRVDDGSMAGSSKSDYLSPIQVITTQDLVNMEATPPMPEPVGMAAIRDAWKNTMGTELTAASFAALPNIGAFDNPTKYGVRDPNNPLNYIINTNYGTFSFPFTIAIFQVPLHHRGPVLKYSDEVDTNGNLKPLESSSEKPGYIGTKDVRLVYQSPFGEVNSSIINLDRKIQRQLDTVELDEHGNPIEGEVSDLFEEQTQEGGIDEGQYTEDEQEIFTERQFKNWMYDKLMEDYGDVKWTSTPFKQHFHLWNKDYVTGKMLLEKFGTDPDFKLPGVDYSVYEARASELGIQMVSQVTDDEAQDDQAANMLGLGAFTNSQGFTVTDVTAKWGTMEAANARYTGDVGMSMVPYEANVKNEQLGYMAMSNLSGLGYPGEGVIDDAKGFAADVTMEAAKWSGLGVGLGLGGAVMILAGGVAVGIAAKESGKAVWTILNKKSPNSI